ncbi:aminopeptidase [Chloroflexota bacterium]
MDKRWKKLGNLMVQWSTVVQPNDRVMIAMSEVETYPLVHAIYEAVIEAGAYPQVQFLSESLRHVFLTQGNTEQQSWVPEIESSGMEWADVYFGLRGGHNMSIHADVPADQLTANQVAMGKVSRLRWQKTRWCLSRVPNPAFAQQAETEFKSLMDMYFNACFLNWEVESKRWRALANQLEHGQLIRILGKDTDLSFSVEGRQWMVFDGKINMPDGEIFTAPVNKTLNGHIYFENPGVLGGRLMHDIRLCWKNGELIEATSSSNQDYLHQILRSDEGSNKLGEFALGMNPHVDRFCNDILIDEKIGGTIHIALGRAYPECEGTNQSNIHWDIVKDLRSEGVVTLDDQAILEDGVVVL